MIAIQGRGLVCVCGRKLAHTPSNQNTYTALSKTIQLCITGVHRVDQQGILILYKLTNKKHRTTKLHAHGHGQPNMYLYITLL